jgi:hypothetical protein
VRCDQVSTGSSHTVVAEKTEGILGAVDYQAKSQFVYLIVVGKPKAQEKGPSDGVYCQTPKQNKVNRPLLRTDSIPKYI